MVTDKFSLNSAQKRAVLDSVRARIIRDHEDPDRRPSGICTQIKEVIYNVYHVRILTHEIKDIFPKFTYENAEFVSDGVICECSEPKECHNWWSLIPYNYVSRIIFIDWLKRNL